MGYIGQDADGSEIWAPDHSPSKEARDHAIASRRIPTALAWVARSDMRIEGPEIADGRVLIPKDHLDAILDALEPICQDNGVGAGLDAWEHLEHVIYDVTGGSLWERG